LSTSSIISFGGGDVNFETDIETIKEELSKDYFVNDNKDKKNNNINEYS